MKLKSLLLTASAFAVLATSCKKDDNNSNGGGSNAAPSASTLTAGNGYIAFNTDKAFNGSTSHTYAPKAPYDIVTAVTSNNAAVLQGAHTEVSGTTVGKISTASLQIFDAKVGSIDFGSANAVFAIAVRNGTSQTVTEAYAMASGTVQVTKFSNNELEGKFSGKCVNDDKNTEINITNGTFAAKF